ncbi:specifically androgen-regulated gene protein isoform X2 [Peromyscus californicus insignis]|uniref:specifically androgen-regulated gene protein isoform X2 n=1 Tax=Peromyscus californicus insignis TaxID=564181 RepID=UPI0022A6DB70|nr:specifically androgen-regulated gene protein isoform X2 [Peromyscus californicus insignis]
MPKRELWPAGSCSEPVTHIGSCDSMMSTTSTRSGSSDNSYDFLSAEEKECLLFLEKTIGSLEAEADSGLSTDESEPATSPGSFRALPITQQAPQVPTGNPEVRGTQQVPAPKREAHSSGPPESPGLGLRSGSYSLPRNLHFGRSQNLRESATQTNSHGSETPEVLAEPEKGRTSQSTQPIQPIQPPAPSQQTTLDLSTVLIPPPEAFQDIRPRQSGEESPPEELGEKRHTPQAGTLLSSQKKEEISSETMSHKATEKGRTGGPQQPQLPPAQSSQNIRAEEAPLPSEVKPNIQQAPLTASKPRRLPPNIVLKSSRSSFHSHPQNWLSNHTEAADSVPVPSSLQEQKKARREALEKLGLPQDQDDPSLLVKHPSTLKVKEAQAQSPSQAQAVVQHTPPTTVPGAASAAGKTSPGKAVTPMASSGKRIPAQETPPGKVAAAKSMPIPIPKASKENSSLTRPKPDPRLTLQESSIPGLRQINFKSNTLERSGVGLSSYLSAAEKDPKCQTSTSLGKSPILGKASPSILRNSRPRPASLGMGKDFAEIQGGKLVGLEQGQRSQQLSFKGQSHDKLPRPPCVSVKISPKGIPDGHRREALKKLGLLKE